MKYLPFYNLYTSQEGRMLFKPYFRQCYIVPAEHEKSLRDFIRQVNIIFNIAFVCIPLLNFKIGLAIGLMGQIYYSFRSWHLTKFLIPTEERITRQHEQNVKITAMAEKISFFGLYGMIFFLLLISILGFMLMIEKDEISYKLAGVVLVVAIMYAVSFYLRLIKIKRQINRAKKTHAI